MQGLEMFVTVVVPITILLLVAMGSIIAMLGAFYQQRSWDKTDHIEDFMDSFHYHLKRVDEEDAQVKVYADLNAVTKILTKENSCPLIGSASPMKRFVKSSMPPSLRIREKSSSSRRMCRVGSIRFGMEEVETTSRSTS